MSDRKLDIYLYRCSGGKWAISREIAGQWIYLVQGNSVDDPQHVDMILMALGIPTTTRNHNRYFPYRPRKKRRCPTLKLLERFARLGTVRHEAGV
jgi:hypothetical protein